MSRCRFAFGFAAIVSSCGFLQSPASADGARQSLELPECGGAEAQKEIREKLANYEIYRSNLGELGSLLLEGAWLKAHGGITNHDGDSITAAGVATDLDKTVEDYAVEIGWYGRPILRDALLHNSEEFRREYACWSARKRKHELRRPDDWIYWGLVEAVRIDLTIGYGTLVDDPVGDLNAKTDTGTRYNATIRWEIPLSGGAGWNPFD